MQTVKQAIKKNINIIFVCLFELAVGILMLINPDAFTSAVIIIGGLVLMGAGLYSSVRYFKEEQIKAASGQLLMTGLALILAGAFCVFRSDWFIANIPLYTAVYGVVILMLALCKVQIAVDSLRAGNKKWFLFAIGAAVTAICAVAVLTDLFGRGVRESLWVFTGVSLIVLSVLDVASLCVSKFNKKKGPEVIAPSPEENEEE